MVGHVGRPADLVLVAGDEHPILRGDEVGLDVVGAHAGAQRVRGQGVLRAVSRGAAMGDDERLGLLTAPLGGGGPGHGGGHDDGGDGEERQTST
jgi:hypothetical protein